MSWILLCICILPESGTGTELVTPTSIFLTTTLLSILSLTCSALYKCLQGMRTCLESWIAYCYVWALQITWSWRKAGAKNTCTCNALLLPSSDSRRQPFRNDCCNDKSVANGKPKNSSLFLPEVMRNCCMYTTEFLLKGDGTVAVPFSLCFLLSCSCRAHDCLFYPLAAFFVLPSNAEYFMLCFLMCPKMCACQLLKLHSLWDY